MPPIWVGFGPKFSKQGSLFRQIFHKMGGLSINWRIKQKMGRFPPKFVIKVGITASFGNKKRVPF